MTNKFEIAMDSSPAHAIALGRLVAHWAVLERLMIHILKYLLSVDWKRAKIVFEEFTSIRGKITLLRRLNHFWTADQAMKNEIDIYLKEAEKLNKDRNRFIHSLWGAPSWSRDTLHMGRQKTMAPPKHTKIDNPVIMTTPQDIEKVVNHIAELSESLRLWILRVSSIPPQQP